MEVKITKRFDRQFPIGLVSETRLENFTLGAAIELRAELDNAIKWAVDKTDNA